MWFACLYVCVDACSFFRVFVWGIGVCVCVCVCVCGFVCVFVCSFVCLFVRLFACLLIGSSVRLKVRVPVFVGRCLFLRALLFDSCCV